MSRIYRARVRKPGCRKYQLVGNDRDNMHDAYTDLCGAFKTQTHKRGDVLVCDDNYDPVQVVEIVRK